VVHYVISGTVEFGKHISPIEREGSIQIPAGEERAVVNYEIITANIQPSDNYAISIRIVSVEGDNAVISPGLSSFTNEIRIRCESSIPEGRFLETTAGEEVQVTKIDESTFHISNLNFRYYLGPAYGMIPGEFEDRCNVIHLLGTEISDKFRVAWIGNGSWDEENQTLSLTVSDQTFNPDYKVRMEFKFMP
jgi:hypothetical protein